MSTVQTDALIPIDLKMTRVFVLRGRRPILIDTGYPGDDSKIIAALLSLGIEPADLSLIILTHGHHDHFGGAAALQRATGATLAVGLRDAALARMAAEPHYHPGNFMGRLVATFNLTREPDNLEPAAPDWYIDGEVDLQPYGIEGRVIQTPGHTAGSLSIALESGEVIIGDLLMGFPLAGRSGKPIFIENMEAWKESVRKVMASRPRILHVTHGGPIEPARVLRAFPWAAP